MRSSKGGESRLCSQPHYLQFQSRKPDHDPCRQFQAASASFTFLPDVSVLLLPVVPHVPRLRAESRHPPRQLRSPKTPTNFQALFPAWGWQNGSPSNKSISSAHCLWQDRALTLTVDQCRRSPQAKNEHSRDIVSRFLQADPTQRLGNLAGGIDEARKHPYFAAIDWNALANKKMPVSGTAVPKC